MLIPYNTDAPIYHWPFATVGMIVVNAYVFMACCMTSLQYEREEREDTPTVEEILADDELEFEFEFADANPWDKTVDPWILHYGTIRPWEWVTSNFIHGDIIHLIGNMAVLWGLGLIVEGKVGWWRFLLIYLGIGISECALEQTLMFFFAEGGSYGASSIVFGLVAITLLWAPRNDVHCVILLGYVWMAEVAITTYAAIVLGLEVLLAVAWSFAPGSAVLHLLGAGVGAIVGTAMIKLNWVDCEGYDFFAVMAGREGQRRRVEEEEEKLTPELIAQRKEMAMNQIRHLLTEDQPQLAYAAHQRMHREYPDWHLPAAIYLKLLAGYQKQKLWVDLIPIMVQYLKHYDQRIAQVRLQLAKILLEHDDRPAQAEAVLARIPEAELDEQLTKIRDNLVHKARKKREEGSIETAVENW